MNDEKKKAFHEFPKIDGSNFKKISNFEGRKIKKISKDVQEKRISISNLKIRMMKRNFFKIESQISK